MPEKKLQKVTIFLLKERITSPSEALREPDNVEEIAVSGEDIEEGTIFIRKSHPHMPSWAEFIRPVIASPAELDSLRVSSASAVLALKVKERWFAVTFGYGRTLLKPNSFERSFGLRCVVNRVDPDKLRNVDTRLYDTLAVSSKKQASKGSSITVFDLNINRDILNGVAGEPRSLSFAEFAIGGDSLTLHARVEAQDLEATCANCLQAYGDKTYVQHFPWIDNIGEVRDSDLIDKLDGKLIQKLRSYTSADFDDDSFPYLAPAAVLEWERYLPRFSYSGCRHKVIYGDISIHDYLTGALSASDRAALTLDMLQRHEICIFPDDGSAAYPAWSIYDCLIWETELDGELFVLLDQRWFNVEGSFADDVRNFFSKIPQPVPNLPVAPVGDEELYNNQVGNLADYLCLDQKWIYPDGNNSKMEACDLLSTGKQLIHIKKKTRSATLSHLFAQGHVSALSLLRSVKARDDLRTHLATKTGFENLVLSGSFIPTEYEIVFGIIAKHGPKGPRKLPFFSLVNLKQHVEALTAYGFRISLQVIDEK